MRVVLVHKFFHVTGGAEVFFFETGRVLAERNHEVAYFSTTDERNRPSSYSSYFVKAPDYRNGNILKRIGNAGKIVYSFEARKKFRRLLRDFKPDIVHVFAMFTHLSPAILDACREAGVPVVLSCNDYKHICPNYKLFHHERLCEDCKDGRFYRAVCNRCCQDSLMFSVASALEAYTHNALNLLRRNIHTFLFSSEFMAKETEKFWGRNNFRWRKLLNPFNSRDYVFSAEYDDYLLFFGRLIEEKGVDVLLRAMQKAPQSRLVVVGDGPASGELRNLAETLQLKNVDFVGPKWGGALDALLERARFVVVPSVWHENFPYVILQSFAFGKAVVGSDRGGIPELIRRGEYGFIYPAQSPKILAEHIRELWNNPEVAVKMGRAAKEYVDNEFSDEKFYNAIAGIYEEVLAEKRDSIREGAYRAL